MQACARHRRDPLGGVRRVLGEDVHERIIDAGAVAVLTRTASCAAGARFPEARHRRSPGPGGCEGVKHVVVYKRTGSAIAMQSRATCGGTTPVKGRPIPASPPGSTPSIRCSSSTPPARRASKGGAALHRRLPAPVRAHHEMDVRLQAERRFLVHRRRGLGHRHSYIATGPLAGGRDRRDLRGRPTYPDAGRFWKLIQDHKSRCSTPRRRRSARSSRRARLPEKVRSSNRCAFSNGRGRSIPRPGSGTTKRSAAAAAPS